MSQPTITDAQRDRVLAARAYVHQHTCPRGRLDPTPCPACPSTLGLHNAITVLDARPRDARAARRALHDVVCRSGCGPESDHAARAQAAPVASLRKYLAQE